MGRVTVLLIRQQGILGEVGHFCVLRQVVNVINNRSACRNRPVSPGGVPIHLRQMQGSLSTMYVPFDRGRAGTGRERSISCNVFKAASPLSRNSKQTQGSSFCSSRLICPTIRTKLGTSQCKTLHWSRKERNSVILERACRLRIASIV